MAQEDYVIADQTGVSFLSDLNDTLAAIVSNNSGATEPATMYAYMFWADTTAGILKHRNAANNAWINVFTLVGIKASDIRNTAAGTIAATTVQAALNELDTEKAALAGATFTGRLIASLNSNINLSGINGAFIVGGDGSGSHIAMDSNEIQAKGSPTTNSALFINNEGGRVQFGGDITAVGAEFTGQAKGITPVDDEDLTRKDYVDNLPLNKQYESPEQTITSGGALTLSHGLGSQPKLYLGFLKCTSAQRGYSVGDEVAIALGNVSDDAGTSRGISVVPNASNLVIRYGSQSGDVFIGLNKSSGDRTLFTNTDWKLIMRAYV